MGERDSHNAELWLMNEYDIFVIDTYLHNCP